MAFLKILLHKIIFILKILEILQFKYTNQGLVHVTETVLKECNYMLSDLTDHFSVENFKVFLQLFFAFEKTRNEKISYFKSP